MAPIEGGDVASRELGRRRRWRAALLRRRTCRSNDER